MASKKYLLLAGFIALFTANSAKAQDGNSGMYRGGGYDVSDTSLIPEKRLPQQRDFLNNQYDFPAKPRNQWEIGISGGLLNVSGDVKSRSIFNRAVKPLNTMGFGLSVRKAWGYVISTRLQFIHGSASGYNYEQSQGYWGHGNQNPWTRTGYGSSSVNYNYKTTINELSIQVVAALNNLKFHNARNKVSYYALAGFGALTYNTKVDALDAAGNKYAFNNIGIGLTGSAYENRKDIDNQLKDMFDGEYESEGESHTNRGELAGGTLRGMATAGAGIQIRLSKKLSLQIEDKVTFSSDDLIDGQRWQEYPGVASNAPSSLTRDFDNINYFSVGLNLNVGGKAVEPLWWMNALDYGYNEMKRPQAKVEDCSKDADGDGISDCFDRCPNTPGNVSVDSHGCPFDTDGDGVADYKDKQLITPTECQPVDADGVGKCPDPECCTRMKHEEVKSGCNSIPSGSINFASGVSKLGSSAMNQLNSLANAMKSNPNCRAVIIGNGSGTKVQQQRSWDRVNSVINYMVDKQGIDRERFIFQYGNSTGDVDAVDYRSAGNDETGPSNTPPPFPNLRK